MRDADYIHNLWQQGGPFIGDEGKPHSRVTVQDPWDIGAPGVFTGDEDHVIHPNVANVNYRTRGTPVRWYQKDDNSQNEREVPNVLSINIDRSIDTDAATCDIVVKNQWMYNNGDVPTDFVEQGNRQLAGFFSPGWGQTPESQARWGHEVNEWENTFVPNTIIRTYQGYGGYSKTLADCLTDGNLILTGVWLIDEVRVMTDGNLSVRCRDMAKLLIDQQLFPPLVPSYRYPLTYYRYSTDDFAVRARATTVTSSSRTTVTRGDKRCVFAGSEVDMWYPEGSPGSDIPDGGYILNGHRGSHSIDGRNDTYYLGIGNSGPDRDFSVMWIEYSCGEWIDAVYMNPWGGNYVMYISVMEDGIWQGSETIPYDHSELIGQDYVVDTGADIRYVRRYGVPVESGQQYQLPRYYNADRVRISFRHLTYTNIGPYNYRGGVREVRLRSTQNTTVANGTTGRVVQPIFWAGDALIDPDNLNATGYMTATQLGQIDAFGDLRRASQTAGNVPTSSNVIWLETTRSGDGYWVLRADGSVTAYGNATFYGSPRDDGITVTALNRWYSIVQTYTGEGYWVIQGNGTIRSYGDAPVYSNLTVASGEVVSAAHSLYGDYGFWVFDTDGVVYARGAATHLGNFSEAALTNSSDRIGTYIVGNTTDDGYWLLSSDGRVQNRGAADDFGQVDTLVLSRDSRRRYYHIFPSPADTGYLILRGDGVMYPRGDVEYFGSPIPGDTGQIRTDGNYTDYADIIKDLALWSGFWLHQDGYDSDVDVFGNIESTGSFSRQKLPDDLFDKRPVIDSMTEIKEAVGYILFIDDEGGFRFESPNFWTFGNNIQNTGQRIAEVPEIDERVQLFEYGMSRNDESLRSMIIISSEDPTEAGNSTVSTKIVPQTADGLRGILKPAMWINGFFQDEDEQRVMAELIALHIWFAQRLGQATIQANPAIQMNDQVRVYERQTGEVFLHYVRGVSSSHNLETGEYVMTLTTHWLGTGEEWAITDSPEYIDEPNYFVVSPLLVEFLQGTSGEGTNFSLGYQNTTSGPVDPNGPGGVGTGSGPG